MRKPYKQLTYDDRIKIEALYNAGVPVSSIALQLGVHVSTIYRDIKRGMYASHDYELRPVFHYGADRAQQKRDFLSSSKGAPVRYAHCYELFDFIEYKIIHDKYSPAAVAFELRKHDSLPYVCESTIYRYIEQGYFLHLERKHLPERGVRKHPYKRIARTHRQLYGVSIEHRPAIVSVRDSFGHWELDSVIGHNSGNNQSCLVFTERLSRAELVFKVPSKTAHSTVRVLDELQRHCKFSKLFKTITVDNGCEFADSFRMEHSPAGRRRTRVFYCHPYTSCERGSNENANRLVRRWFVKGSDFSRLRASDCLQLSRWMNSYPRDLLGGKTPSELFIDACNAEGIKISSYLSQYLC